MLESVKGTVSGLSDLRYGRFNNAVVGEEVVSALKDLKRSEDKSLVHQSRFWIGLKDASVWSSA